MTRFIRRKNEEVAQEIKKKKDHLQQVQAALESQNYRLKAENDKLKHSVYIPHKDDTTDRILGEYINSRPENDRLNIMFLRESEGIYRFGQKRVYVKTEKGGQMKVRVGGGFMSIGKFIQDYSIEEQKKIERRNPVQKF